MKRTASVRVVVTVVALLSGLLAGTASASPGTDVRSEHQRIVEFWTHARVAQAVPLDIVFERGPGFVPAEKPTGTPGNGPGKGGNDGEEVSDPSLVTGASWNEGGPVSQTTGKVLFQLGSSYYVCSASVVVDPDGTDDDDSLVLTAGHCAHDQTDEGFAQNWVFIPAYDEAAAPLTTDGSFCDDTKYGCWTATALTVHDLFASAGGFNDQAVKYDFAVATVGTGGGGINGVSGDLESIVGAQGITFSSDITNSTAFALGYPAAKKYKGNDLVYCMGPVGTDPNVDGATYRIECDMTGGSSGGPWLTEVEGAPGTLVSVNSYGYRGDTAMYGPRLGGKAFVVYEEATKPTVTGNQVVVGG